MPHGRAAAQVQVRVEQPRRASERREKKSHHTQLMAIDFTDGSYYFS